MSLWIASSRVSTLPDPLPEQVGGQGGVAQLADMGPGVGEPERAVALLQEQLHPLDVVVGQHGPHPQLEPGLGEGEVEQQVEGIDASLGGDGGQLASGPAPGWPPRA